MKQHYKWWGYIKAIVREYPRGRQSELSGVELREHEAVKKAVDDTLMMDGGANRLKVIRMVHWERTRTLEGAALSIPCDRATAARWQRRFFEGTARNMGLMDAVGGGRTQYVMTEADVDELIRRNEEILHDI